MNINTYLIYPMFALVILKFVVSLIMVRARFRAVRSGQMEVKYFKTYNLDGATDLVLKTGRNFTNLFELPVIFYAGCIVAMILPIGGWMILFWAWLFVVARVIHSFIHIGSNKIYPRMISFGISGIAVLAIWIQIIMNSTRVM